MWFDTFFDNLPVKDPTWIFFLVLIIILFAPILFAKFKIPHIVGMILAGVLVGPFGLHLLEKDSSFDLFGNVGLYYIMFLAGMEMNMHNMRRIRKQATTLGLAMFVVPLVIGVLGNMLLLKYSFVTSVLLGSMYASHTLISYPVVIRYGLARNRSVSIAIGGTIVTDILTLLTLAFIVGMFREETNDGWVRLLFLLLKVIVLSLLIMRLYPRIARWFFRRYNGYIIQFVFVLALVFLSAGLMRAIGMEGLLGAFMAGLVLNRLVPHGTPLMHYLEFVGNALFIPYFLIGVGMIVDLHILFGSISTLKVAFVMIVIALGGKWIASWLTQKIFKMTSIERELIFGLSNASAAATLAAMLVGYDTILPSGERLLNEDVLNGTTLLILTTCLVSSFSTAASARRLALSGEGKSLKRQRDDDSTLVAIAYPEMVRDLMNMALLMRNPKSEAPMSAINVVQDSDDIAQEQGEKLLEAASAVASAAGIQLKTNVRLATNLGNGIIHAVKENDYGEVIVGLHMRTSPDEAFFGPVLTALLNRLNRQIMMIRCSVPPNTIRRIHVSVPEKAQFEAGFAHWLERVLQFSEALGCRIIFHAHPETIRLLQRYHVTHHTSSRATYIETDGGNELKNISSDIANDHMLVVVMARKGSISYRPSFEHIPYQITKYYHSAGLMLIFPDIYAATSTKDLSLNDPIVREDSYESSKEWYKIRITRAIVDKEKENLS